MYLNKLFAVVGLLLLAPIAAMPAPATGKTGYTGQLKTAHLTENEVNFIRPGIQVKVVSAAVASNGTISVRFTIADPKGLPLDRNGITTPGAVSVSFIAAYIPKGQSQYVAYTTRALASTLNNNPTQIQAGTDSGGTYVANADGDYTYTFKTKAPANFDATAVHAIGVYAVRDLSEFMDYAEWSEASNAVYNFLPSTGAAVAQPRSIASTQACNGCHNPLFGHGGSRLTVEMCILCHTPQTVNPDTQLTQDMRVLIHKIHMGANLPTVKAGIPYRIWHRGAWSDFSDVVFPQDIRNCTVCHNNATQADNWKNNPSIAACGSCHDDINFTTGQGHVNLPTNDSQCKNCHWGESTGDFDPSVPGAHVVPMKAQAMPGIVLKILKVENATPGNAPKVTFNVTDKSGVPVDISKLTSIRIYLAGPNVDYQTGPAGIRVNEDPSKTAGAAGNYIYQMTNKIPDAAAGSYTITMQARNTVTLMAGTVKQTTATDAATPVEYYFSVDKSPMVARRQVVSTDKCAACHENLKFVHGGTRNNTQECVICHNPSLVDGTSKQSVNFAWQIHSIHRGENLANPYVLGTTNYQEVRFPGDAADCSTCHVNNSYQPDNVGAVAAVASTGGFTPTTMPIAAACQGCHDDKATASHALANTTSLGEACVVCHGQNAEFSIDKVHSPIQ